MTSLARTGTMCLWFLAATLCFTSLATAADLNDILMCSDHDCNNSYGHQLACTDVPVDFCCFADMPFCNIAVYNKAKIPEMTVSAWPNANTCDTSVPAPLYCVEGFCSCMHAYDDGATTGSCAALWSTRRGMASRDARVGIGAKTGCRKADTLRYTDAEGRKMEIKGITDSNYSDVMAHYHAGNYTHLSALAL